MQPTIIISFSIPSGTHHRWVGRGSVCKEVCLILLHLTSSGYRTPDLLILSTMPHTYTHRSSYSAPTGWAHLLLTPINPNHTGPVTRHPTTCIIWPQNWENNSKHRQNKQCHLCPEYIFLLVALVFFFFFFFFFFFLFFFMQLNRMIRSEFTINIISTAVRFCTCSLMWSRNCCSII